MRLPCDLSRFPQQQDSVTAFLLEGWRSRRKTLEPLGQPWVLGNTDNGDLGWGEEMPLVRGLARCRRAGLPCPHRKGCFSSAPRGANGRSRSYEANR